MCTVLITYPTPPPPSEEPRLPPGDGDRTSGSVDRATTSVASTTAGIDEAIAATIADELSIVGHQVTCRPCVAAPVTGGYDLVVDVERLRVTHRGMPTQRAPRRRRLLPDQASSDERNHTGESTIPMTWSADWRAVDAWARTIGDSLARYLELRSELTRVRTELEHCRELLHAATASPAPAPVVEAPHLTVADKTHGHHRHRRLAPAGSAREP